ncbi:redoxin domain-containing protein, partial [Candidatus Amesbacteria bacterium]|nr:redoxin domain-containing protein [Candidatus Amesbacteria bacterium]
GKNVLLFFNEGLMCYPACWDQIAAFGADGGFAAANTVVLSITVDPQSQWQQAIAKMPKLAAATVLLDTQKEASTKYGVLSLESSMHRGQFPGHTYVLIDASGVVRYLLDDPTMATRNQQLQAEIAKL